MKFKEVVDLKLGSLIYSSSHYGMVLENDGENEMVLVIKRKHQGALLSVDNISYITLSRDCQVCEDAHWREPFLEDVDKLHALLCQWKVRG